MMRGLFGQGTTNYVHDKGSILSGRYMVKGLHNKAIKLVDKYMVKGTSMW